VTARSIAGLQATGRLLLGGGLVALPSLVAVPWVGEPAHSAGGRTLAAGLGARDVAIALGTLGALAGGGRPSAWVRAGMLADFADLAATLRHRDDLPPLIVPAVGGLAGASVLLGAYLQHVLD
jgi:hypothetical protein